MTTTPFTDTEAAAIQDGFHFHPANATTGAIHDNWRLACSYLAREAITTLGDTPEARNALYHIRIAMMWGNASIACHDAPDTP